MSKIITALFIVVMMITQSAMASTTNRCESEAKEIAAAAWIRDKNVTTREALITYAKVTAKDSYERAVAIAAMEIAYENPKVSGERLADLYTKTCNKKRKE